MVLIHSKKSKYPNLRTVTIITRKIITNNEILFVLFFKFLCLLASRLLNFTAINFSYYKHDLS
jgi:hypothetical protein